MLAPPSFPLFPKWSWLDRFVQPALRLALYFPSHGTPFLSSTLSRKCSLLQATSLSLPAQPVCLGFHQKSHIKIYYLQNADHFWIANLFPAECFSCIELVSLDMCLLLSGFCTYIYVGFFPHETERCCFVSTNYLGNALGTMSGGMNEPVLLNRMPDPMQVHYCKWRIDLTCVSGPMMSSLFSRNRMLLF